MASHPHVQAHIEEVLSRTSFHRQLLLRNNINSIIKTSSLGRGWGRRGKIVKGKTAAQCQCGYEPREKEGFVDQVTPPAINKPSPCCAEVEANGLMCSGWVQ